MVNCSWCRVEIPAKKVRICAVCEKVTCSDDRCGVLTYKEETVVELWVCQACIAESIEMWLNSAGNDVEPKGSG